MRESSYAHGKTVHYLEPSVSDELLAVDRMTSNIRMNTRMISQEIEVKRIESIKKWMNK